MTTNMHLYSMHFLVETQGAPTEFQEQNNILIRWVFLLAEVDHFGIQAAFGLGLVRPLSSVCLLRSQERVDPLLTSLRFCLNERQHSED